MTHKKTEEGYPIFRSYLEEENDKPYYSMNTLSFYYEDMERKQKLIEDLAKAIAGYDQTLTTNLAAIEQQVAERFEQWDEKLKTFDGSVMDLLQEWVDDGTMDRIVDSSIVDRKLEPIAAQLAEKTDYLQAVEYRTKENDIKPTFVFISDDGFKADLTKLKPIFDAKGVPCVSAVVTERIIVGSSAHMTVADLRDIQADGWEIASHTWRHPEDTSALPDSEIELELSASKNYLESHGLKVSSIVYPKGSANSNVRKISKKYYRSGVVTQPEINKPPVDTFSLKRIALGSYFNPPTAEHPETNNFSYQKHFIDRAFDENGLLIFMMHPNSAEHDETQQQILQDVIDYIQSRDGDILTLSDALDRYSNYMDIGDIQDGNYFVIGRDGKAYSSTLDETGVGLLGSAGIDINSPPEKFPMNKLSFVTFESTDQRQGFPERGYGLLEVRNFRSDILMPMQTWRPYSSSNQYNRHYISGAWTPFRLVNQQNTHYINPSRNPTEYNGLSPITEFPNKSITTFYANTGGAAGLPTAGFVTTYRFGDPGWDRQEFHQYNSTNVARRYVIAATGAWSDWIISGGGVGTTENRPTNAAEGYFYYDMTLGKPIWLRARPSIWVDATGARV